MVPSNQVGARLVYNRAPGDILTCPDCGAGLLVAVHVPSAYHMTFDRLRSLRLSDS